jgi:hypothetical protein
MPRKIKQHTNSFIKAKVPLVAQGSSVLPNLAKSRHFKEGHLVDFMFGGQLDPRHPMANIFVSKLKPSMAKKHAKRERNVLMVCVD